MSWTPCRSREMMWKLTVCCASANMRKGAPTLSRYCWLGLGQNWTFESFVHESCRKDCLSFKQQTQKWKKVEMLLVAGDHHHFPVCGGCAAALHVVPASGGPSYSQTWPTCTDAAQRGGLWSNSSPLCIYCFQSPESPCIYSMLLCLFSGNAPTNGQCYTERKHGPGACGGCTAALEEAGPGATQDCLWPP